MAERRVTLIDEGREEVVAATVKGDSLRTRATERTNAIGWPPPAPGLCRGAVHGAAAGAGAAAPRPAARRSVRGGRGRPGRGAGAGGGGGGPAAARGAVLLG